MLRSLAVGTLLSLLQRRCQRCAKFEKGGLERSSRMARSAWKAATTYSDVIQQRYFVTLMMLLGCTNMFAMRVCLSVAIVEMTSPEDEVNKWANSSCPLNIENLTDAVLHNNTKSTRPPELSWSEEIQGIVLSAFFIGYVPAHTVAPYICGLLGGKYSLGYALLSSSLCTLLAPTAAAAGWQWLVFVRIVAGFGEGLSFPAMSVILAHWIPPRERSTASTFTFAGAQMGTVIGSALSGVLLHMFDWPVTFYFYGTCGLAWCVLWQFLCYSKPSLHPFISDKEHKYISESIKPDKRVRRVPLRAILTSPAVWALMLGQFGHDWGFFTMITDLPSYMSYVLHYSIRVDGLLSALPYVLMWICSNSIAVLADWIIGSKKLSVVNVRRICTVIGAVFPALGLMAASFAGCDRKLMVVALCIGSAGMGGFYPGLRSNALDISKNYAATVMALTNGFGALAGIMSPYLIGMLTTDNTIGEWRTVFWVTAGVLIITVIAYCFLAEGTYQSWDIQEQEDGYRPENSIDALAISGEDFTGRF